MKRLFSNRTKDRERLRILLISTDPAYCAKWQRIFDSRGWSLECATKLDGAVGASVVVYDSDASGDEDWHEVLHTLGSLPERPCILLASSVIDEGFRDEVVGLKGYDVLRRQADEDEIARTINSAWFWKHRDA